MFSKFIIFATIVSVALSDAAVDTSLQPGQPELSPSYTAPSLQPVYSPSNQAGYGSMQPSNNQPTYGDVYPTYSGYPDYSAFGYGAPYPVQKSGESGIVRTLGTVLPILRAFHMVLRIAGKVGLFLLGGAVLLVVGGAFTAAVCAVTPICTLSFMGYGLSKEQVRSMMTPDRISVATNLVNEAIDKYQKLQGAIDSKVL